VEIRPADPSEFAAVGEVCAAAYGEFTASSSTGYVDQLRDVARRAAVAEVLVAADPGGPVLGTVTFVPDGGPLGEIATPSETEFRMLAVDPAARGHGVGAALLRRVVEASRRPGKDGIVCSSLPTMRAAHRLYVRAGFARAPGRDWSPIAGVDLLSFVRAL
jgi:GNAT superfamily N-acetyltransferase